jgi:hypothetical protein
LPLDPTAPLVLAVARSGYETFIIVNASVGLSISINDDYHVEFSITIGPVDFHMST